MDLLSSNNGHQVFASRKNPKSHVQMLTKQILDHRYFFLISITIGLVLAYLSIRYTTPVYLVKTSVLIKETKNPSNNPQGLLYGEGDAANADRNHIPEEVAILQSYPFIYRTLDSLNMRVTYYLEGRFRKDEVYDLPIAISFPDKSRYENLVNRSFSVTFSDDQHFELRELTETQPPKLMGRAYRLNDTLQLYGCPVLVKASGRVVNFEFQVNDLPSQALDIKGQLNIRSNGTESSILDIYLATTVPQKGIDFLNEFTKQYLNYKYEEKSRAVSQSLTFINDQLEDISRSLGSTESNLEKFKSSNTFSDASKMTDRDLDALTDLEKERLSLLLNERYYTNMLQNLEANKAGEQLIAPSSVGVQDMQTDGLVNQLVTLEMEKNSFHETAGTKNPLIKDIDSKINSVRSTLKGNIASLLSSNRTKLAQVNAKSSQHQASVNKLPGAERKFVDINRENNLNEQIYLFLSQKKLEAGILKAATTVENKVIESAMLDSSVPLKPKKTNNYAVGLLLGLAFPFISIWLRKLFSKKIGDKAEFKAMTSLPVIGTIYHNLDASTQVITAGSRTAISESFRLLRSHLTSVHGYDDSKAFLVTSMDSGEGKSFSSVNIAASLALIKKKTVLVNFDLRTPQHSHPFESNGLGISDYLSENAALEDVITTTNHPYLDYIASGHSQVNASELFNDEKVALLVRQLKNKYAFIIIDSPPLGKIADPFVIGKYTDLNLVIVRLNYTTKEKLFDLEQVVKEGKILNTVVVLNDERLNKEEYKKGYYFDDKAVSKKFSLKTFKPL